MQLSLYVDSRNTLPKQVCLSGIFERVNGKAVSISRRVQAKEIRMLLQLFFIYPSDNTYLFISIFLQLQKS